MLILFMISLKFVPKGLINNISAPTRHQAIISTNDGNFTDAYMRHLVSVN